MVMKTTQEMTKEHFRPADHPHDHFLLTTVVGSYPQPNWLEFVRTELNDDSDRSDDVQEAENDACKAVVTDHECTGLDVITDGEVRREGMVEYFAQFIDGVETDDDGNDGGWNQHMPTIVETISSDVPWLVDDYTFAADIARRPVKTTITGPFTLASFSNPRAYDGVEALAYDFADLIAAEAGRLADAGARWIQIDEPALGMSPHGDIALECLTRISKAVPDDVRLGVHVCSGNYANLVPELFEFPVDEVDLEFASENADDPEDVLGGVDLPFDVSVGVVDTQKKRVESVEEVEANIRRALAVVPPDRLTITPDCGMKPLPRDVAFEKLERLVTAARSVEAELDAE